GMLDVTATAGDASIGGNLDAAGDLTIAADAGTLVGTGTISGGSLDLHGGDVDLSGDLTGGDITLRSLSGDLDFATANGGAISATSAAALTTSGIVTGDSVSLTAATNASINDTVNSSGTLDVTATAGKVTIAGALDATGIGIVGQSGVQVSNRIESDTYLSIVSLADVAVDGELDAGGTVSVVGFGALEGDSAIHGEAVELEGGDVNLGGDIRADAGEIDIEGIRGVQLRGHLQATGGGITVTGSNSVLLESAELKADGDVRISGANTISLDAATLESVGGSVRLQSGDQTLVNSTSSISALNDVSLLGTSGVGTVQLSSDLSIESGGDTNLITSIDGDGSLNVSAKDWILLGGDMELKSITLTGGAVSLGGNWQDTAYEINNVTASGDIGINTTDGSLASSGLPSIFGFGDSLTVQSTGGDLTLGANQGLSYAGDLTLNAHQILTVGDVTATGNLTLMGNQVTVIRRGEVILEQPGDFVPSPQTSIVAGKTLDVQGVLSYVGSGNDPLFGGVVDAKGVPLIDRAAVDAFSRGTLEIDSADGDRMALMELNGFTPSPEPGDEIAAESNQGEVIVELAPGRPDLRTLLLLADLGVEVIDGPDRPAGDQRLARAGHVVNDYRPGAPALETLQATSLIQVSRSRLDPRYARDAVANYALALESAPEGSLVSAAGMVTKAHEAYTVASGSEGDAVPFRTWLASEDPTGGEAVSQLLSRLDKALVDLRRAGLTSAEVEASRRFVMTRLTSIPPASPEKVAVRAEQSSSSS
ncbi:MAG: hypothetical protein GY876_09495, partial [Planctomycetes bacterium]|nr:hypothetical protein [Planctomycetota bacterium]